MWEKNRSQSLFELILLFSVFFLPGYLFGMPSGGGEFFNSATYHLMIIVTGIPAVLLLLYIISLRRSPTLTEFGFDLPRKKTFPQTLIVVAGILGILIILGIVSAFLPEEVIRNLQPDFSWQFDRPELVPLLIVSALVTGYYEESFFRAYLITRFERFGLTPVGALAAGALLFASGHLYQGLPGFIVTLMLGLFLGFMFTRYRSVHPIAIGHAGYNIVVLLLQMLNLSPDL
ncbi:MAG: CPBP family intramembrane metalloprotease [Spirochaetales bacterium]|nr:CPBP family intramembrane metalloprotease [Spirochaetales bacterium]MCF7937094.1 CPBP family intramembrane metalloprotease [Spirochaetales bacterium]